MYRSQLEADKQEKLEQKKKRLEELMAMLAIQAEYDRDRYDTLVNIPLLAKLLMYLVLPSTGWRLLQSQVPR
jgi:hypothetical protein